MEPKKDNDREVKKKNDQNHNRGEEINRSQT
jgi:hypothetical protein